MINKQLPLFNWSLTKLLSTETSTFQQARIKILFTILVMSLIKIVIVILTASYYHQHFQLMRGIVALVFYSVLFKLLLINKSYLTLITHIMVCFGIVIVWTNIFVSVQSINIVTLQFVFMTMMSSFYFLNKYAGLFYSFLSVLPIIIFFTSLNKDPLRLNISPHELAAPGNITLIMLNFITLIFAHYLYHQAFTASIAEKELLNTQLKKAVEQANRHAQSKSDFLSTMSHELRTPLNSVIGMTDLLIDDPHSEEQKENLKILRFSATSLHTLINDILDFNKLDSDKLHLEAIGVNLNDLMINICAGLDLQAKEKGLNLILDIDESLRSQHIVSDPTRITQIIYNLAGNGIKFTSHGSVTVSLKLLSKNEDAVSIRFAVVDTGIGINADKHKTIFEPFVQASANTTRNFGGSGLGLSIVKHLLSLFGSEVHLESTPEKGSNFFFDIAFPIDKHVVETGITGGESNYDLSGLRILVAEDNRMNIFLIRKLCARWNVEPTIAENGIEVVEKLSVGTYDVILMDIHMPEMDGYEATRRIRRMPDIKSNIPIIALTASVSQDISLKIKEVGMNDYVRKPFNAKELYGKLKQIASMTIEQKYLTETGFISQP